MVFLTKEEMRYFRKTLHMRRSFRATFTESLLRKFTFVERAESPRFPAMMAGIGVSNHVLEEYERWSGEYGNLLVLSNPEYSQRSLLATLKRRHDLTYIKFEDFLNLKKERFDPRFKEIRQWIEDNGWSRFGRRPKYTSKEETVVGLFGIFFPFSRRETYLLFQLPSIRELFGVTGELSFTMVCSSIKHVSKLLPLKGPRG